MRRVLLVVLVVVCAAAVACARAGPLSDQDKAAIQKLHDDYAQAWNVEKPDVAALVKASYAPDAQVLMPNLPAFVGEEAIVKAYSTGTPPKNFKIGGLVIEGHGDVAFTRGSYEGDWPTPSGVMVHDKGKFVDAAKKQADGSWKLVYDIWNSDAPPAALPVPTGALKTEASAELKTLAWFAGTWQFDVDIKESPFGPKGKGSLVQDCRWFATGQQIICTTEGTLPPGPYHEVFVMGYDTEAKAYKGYDVDTSGMLPFTLVFKDNTWTFNYDFKLGGKPAKVRATAFDLARDGCSLKQELSIGGGAWTLVGEGKVHRIGG
jgi:ketosteroid isomerase-like protein